MLDDLYKKASIYTDTTFKTYPRSGHVVTVGPEFTDLASDVVEFLDLLKWDC